MDIKLFEAIKWVSVIMIKKAWSWSNGREPQEYDVQQTCFPLFACIIILPRYGADHYCDYCCDHYCLINSRVCEVTLPAVIQSQSGQVSTNTCHKCSNHDHHALNMIITIIVKLIHFIPSGELELVEQHQIGSNLSWSWWWCQDDDRQDLVEQHQMGSNPDYGIPTPTLVSPPKVEGCFFLSDAESSRGYFRAPSICPARTSTLALLRPIWRLPS